MKGKYDVVIWNNRVRYELCIERQITVLKGNSGTGKSTLVSMVRTLLRRDSGGVHCNMRDSLAVVADEDMFKEKIGKTSGKIFFVDEGNGYVNSKEFAEAVNFSDNYFVIVSRSGQLDWLTYSIDSIFELGTEKKGNVSITRMYRRYLDKAEWYKPDCVVVEDSGSGYEMMQNIFSCPVYSAKGKDNVYNVAVSLMRSNRNVYVIVDGAAFGNCIGRFNFDILRVLVYTPESFEWLLLNTNSIGRFVNISVLTETYNYCDSVKYLSWERFYTDVLKKVLKEKLLVGYTKSKLPDQLKADKIEDEVKTLLKDIDWSDC